MPNKFFLCSFAALQLCSFAGCSDDGLSSMPSQTSASELRTIDAGIVFENESGYFCIPASDVGLESNISMKSLKSSCDCVEPQWVQFLNASGKPESAILLRYRSESASSSNTSDPLDKPKNAARLGVEITLKFGSHDQGELVRSRTFQVNLMHASSPWEESL